GDLHIFVTQQPFRLNPRDGIFLDDAPSRGGEIHYHGYLVIRPAGQLDGPDRSLVNSPNTHLGAILQATHILQIGSKTERPGEKKLFVADQENAGGQNEKGCNNKDAQSKSSGHGPSLRGITQELGDKLVGAVLEILESSLRQDVPPLHQGQT